MNPVIIVTSCHRDVENGRQQAQRDTCFSNPSIPYKFMLGHGNVQQNEDEIIFDVPDGYGGSWKTREGCRWALDSGYDFIFKADIDVYCFTDRLLKSGFEKFDYVGRFVDDQQPDWIVPVGQHGSVELRGNHVRASGFGYWLSKRAAEELVNAEPTPDSKEWVFEDWVTGKVLSQTGITGTHDFRYHPGPHDTCAKLCYKETEPFLNDLCAIHLGESTGVYDKSRMYAIHNGKGVYELVD
jgi:hypothetical protein